MGKTVTVNYDGGRNFRVILQKFYGYSLYKSILKEYN